MDIYRFDADKLLQWPLYKEIVIFLNPLQWVMQLVIVSIMQY